MNLISREYFRLHVYFFFIETQCAYIRKSNNKVHQVSQVSNILFNIKYMYVDNVKKNE